MFVCVRACVSSSGVEFKGGIQRLALCTHDRTHGQMNEGERFVRLGLISVKICYVCYSNQEYGVFKDCAANITAIRDENTWLYKCE